MTIIINTLIWDEWNRAHIARHGVTAEEVEEVCYGNFEIIESYRKRLQLKGYTKKRRKLLIALSPEDKKLQVYGEGVYYPITAFEEVK
jgi:uncharacterized DUF497 family protein